LRTVENRIHSYIKQVLTQKYQSYQTLISSYAFANFMQTIIQKEDTVYQLTKDLSTFSPLKQITRHIQTVQELESRITSVPIQNRIQTFLIEIEKLTERIQSAHEKGLVAKDRSLQSQIEKL